MNPQSVPFFLNKTNEERDLCTVNHEKEKKGFIRLLHARDHGRYDFVGRFCRKRLG